MELTEWACAATAPGSADDPSGLDALDLDWVPFRAPGTVAKALRDAGQWSPGDARDFDASDWWLRATFAAPDAVEGAGESRWALNVAGLATLGDVWLNGALVLTTANMFRSYQADITDHLAPTNEIVVRCAALAPQLAVKRSRPRWKTNLVDHQNMRWFRTTLHGRRPTWTGSSAAVGPWRAVTLDQIPAVRVTGLVLDARPLPDGAGGRVDVTVTVASAAAVGGVTLTIAGASASLEPTGESTFSGSLIVDGVAPWWPATHGDRPLYDATLDVQAGAATETVALGRIGFRSVELGPADAPVLRLNGETVFARGVSWVPVDPIGLAPTTDALRDALVQLRDAGLNVVRVPGTAVYESDTFFDLCDELGLLVWHDLMFARMDYPTDDPDFGAEVQSEVAEFATRVAHHPSVVVVCGGCEIGQQAAMIGRPTPTEELVGGFLADTVAAALPAIPYVADVPIGGTHPFTVDVGFANYFGVGGYRRPLVDARLAGVRFASECLAFSHVPDDQTIDELAAAGVALHDSGWKRGIVRDRGTPWDFEDVRDHYVRELFDVDPAALRAVDPERYLDLGRAATARALTETFGQWRRPDSGCGGGIVLEGRDVLLGAGAGVVDAAGRAKPALHALRSVLAPVALFMSDEGMNGLDAWAFNDRPAPVSGVLSIAAFSGDAKSAQVDHELTVGPRSHVRLRVEELLGAFLDLTYAFRFGPHPPTCVALHWRDGDVELARAIFRPGAPPSERGELGLQATATQVDEGRYSIEVTSERYAHYVQIGGRGVQLSDYGFDVEPGGSITLDATSSGQLRGRVRALNAAESAPITMEHG